MNPRLRNYLVAAIVGALFLAGLFLGGPVGGVLLLVTAGILAALSWVLRNQIRPQGRPLRVAVIVVILVVAVVKFTQ